MTPPVVRSGIVGAAIVEKVLADAVRCRRCGMSERSIMPLDESIGIMAAMDEMRAQWHFRYPFE